MRASEAWTQAKAAYQGVLVPRQEFLSFARERVGEEADLEASRWAELYLCCACVRQDERALAAFDARYIAPLRESDDVKQTLRERLLMPPFRVREFAGRGELRRWVRAAAARAEVDAQRKVREEPVEERLFDALRLTTTHPELAGLKHTGRAQLQSAFAQAVGELEPRDRLFLQHYYLDGMGLVEIGNLYRVVASTVSRSLARTRAELAERIRAHLGSQLGLSAAGVESLVRLLHSQYEP